MMCALLKSKLFGKKRYRNGVALNVLELQEFSTTYITQLKFNNVKKFTTALYEHHVQAPVLQILA